MIKACIFDLDGTLLDTLTSLWYCSRESLRKEGLRTLPKDNYRRYVGDGARVQVQRYLKDTGKVTGQEAAELNPGALTHDPHREEDLEYYYQSYLRELSQHADYEVHPYPGIPELLMELKERGLRLAVFSNKPDEVTGPLIRRFFGETTFDMILGKREDLPRKPDPAGALYILRHWGIGPEETLYFGDTDTDMQTGRRAGMFTLGVTWGFRDREELLNNGADAVIDAPADALAYL